MASSSSSSVQISDIKFTKDRIERFNDGMDICLQDSECKQLFDYYINKLKSSPGKKVWKLWNKANDSTKLDDDLFELIYQIDGFNEAPLLSLSEGTQQIAFIKKQCCILLDSPKHNVHKNFIQYLEKNHINTCRSKR